MLGRALLIHSNEIWALLVEVDTLLQKTGHVYLVEEQANPSTDYFVLPRLSVEGKRIFRCRFKDLPAAEALNGAEVVFVRYIPQAWARLVEANRHAIARLVYFMDDDLLDLNASAGMPLRYRFKLLRFSTSRRAWLTRMGGELWVSTPWLNEKYSTWQPHLVMPKPLSGVFDARRIFYHGSSAHSAEIRWLKPVIEQAMVREPRLVFEIVGGQAVYRLFSGVPRVNVVHPMKWQAYQAFLAMPGRHIGLVPLLDTPFNKARSYTKFFDITHCGAVGIYSPDSCHGVIEHGKNGWVVDMCANQWADAIVRLAQEDDVRVRLLDNARLSMSELAAQ